MMNTQLPATTTIPLNSHVRRAAWSKVMILCVCAGALLLIPLTGLLEPTNVIALLGLCLIPASLAAIQLMIVYRVRLELHPDHVIFLGLGFRLVTTRMNIDRIGPSPWNSRHLALMLRNPAQSVDGLLATVIRKGHRDQTIDLADFLSDAPDDPMLRVLEAYLESRSTMGSGL